MSFAIPSTRVFHRTAEAVRYLRTNAATTPSLKNLADHLGVAPAVAQREFRQLVGISPKRFLQDLAVQRASGLLDRGQDLLSVSLDSGLSGPGRLHDHLIRVEGVSPGEWKNQGKGMEFRYGVGDTPFGQAGVVLTSRGMHRLEFLDAPDDISRLIDMTRRRFPVASFIDDTNGVQKILRQIFSPTAHRFDIRVVATPFQLAVWKAILRLPTGSTTTYKRISIALGDVARTRAVAQALAANPVAVLIPCHRVLREDGALCGYRWGFARKLGLLTREER